MRAYEIVSAAGIDALRLAERPSPQPGPGDPYPMLGVAAPSAGDHDDGHADWPNSGAG